MKTVTWREWSLNCDEEATKNAYQAVAGGGADTCTCNACRNYARARETLFPQEMLGLLSELGIDYRKEAEASRYNRVRSRVHLYSVWFHFVGSIGAGKPPEILFPDKINESLSIGFHERRDLPHHPFRGKPLVQVDFLAEVPWVLDEPEPE